MDEQLMREIEASGLFDERWYRSVYRDVAALPISPLEHYLRFGSAMGRLPSLAFDSVRYVDAHPDVRLARVNPLVHYIRHGRREGRPIEPVRRRQDGPRAAPARRLPMIALVLTWDVGHNPLGRSYMLAEVLNRVVRNVVVAGFQFDRYGNDVWEPVRNGRLPVVRLRGRSFPEFQRDLERIASRARPDIVFACKPRLPSLQLGAMIKHTLGCPLVLDIDDHELSFFKGGDELPLDALRAMVDGSGDGSLGEPYGETWTRIAQGLRGFADQTIVSNVALQEAFGGTVVPHVRDETVFDPALHDKAEARAWLGVPADAKVVLFFGTPRQHKGIDVLARAVGAIGDPAFRLVVVGSAPDAGVTARLEQLAPGRVLFFPNQPFDRIPRIMAVADVVCLPQDEASPISAYQLPAKAIDAIAMGVPLLVAPTPPLMQLVRDGVAIAMDRNRLPQMLQEAVAARRPEAEVRERFLRGYSYDAAARSLREVVNRAVAGVDASRTAALPTLLAEQRRLFPQPRRPEARQDDGATIVMFWKQNDSGLYGRRSDMVLRYLASRPDVRRVLMFDAPISEFDLLRRRDQAPAPTHDRSIYLSAYEKRYGEHDSGKAAFDVFVYPPGRYRDREDGSDRPSLTAAWLEYVERALAREGIDSSRSIFWFYPKIHSATELIDHFRPHKVVVDVVDDHRAWPGIAEDERQRLTDHYRELLGRADMALANCQPVVDAMRPFAPDIRLVPNGCDDRMPTAAPTSAAFARFAAHPGKTIGFVGNLEKKIDIPLLEKIATRFADCQLALLGSTHANPEVRRLQAHPNVLMPGIVPYADVGAWLSRFDVGIVPHLDMELTRSMNPLKLYVYLSCGVPVVSTEVYNLDRSPGFLRIAGSHEEFLSQLQKVLAEGKPAAGALAQYVSENSWGARLAAHVDQLLASPA